MPRTLTKATAILLGFIALKFLLQFLLLGPDYELHRDEFLHLDQANYLAWGYLSVPPFTSWTSYLIQLLGNSIFWIKLFPAVYGALTVLIVWKAIEELGGNLFAQVLGATCIVFSSLLRLNILYQPNSLDVLCWTTLYYALLKYARANNSKWLLISAIVFAIGFLNKYNIVFQLIGLIPALLLTRQRTIFRQPGLYVAIVLAILIISPNLIWQYKNGFPVIHHLKELEKNQLVNVDRVAFLQSQLLFFLGALLVIFSALYALLIYKPFKPFRFFFYSLFFTLAVFMYFKAKDYYAIGIYPIYIAFGSVYLGNILVADWKRYLKPVFIIIPLLLFIPLLKVAFPNQSPEYIVQHPDDYKKLGLLRWEDGKDHALPQDFADMLGWRELALKVDSVYLKMPAKSNTLVLCDNYGQAGAINFYSSQKVHAVSFNADYINWFDLSRKYDNVIRVKESGEAGQELMETSPYFQKSYIAGSVTNKFAREFGTTIFSFIGAKIDIRQRIKEEIEEKKNY